MKPLKLPLQKPTKMSFFSFVINTLLMEERGEMDYEQLRTVVSIIEPILLKNEFEDTKWHQSLFGEPQRLVDELKGGSFTMKELMGLSIYLASYIQHDGPEDHGYGSETNPIVVEQMMGQPFQSI